MVSSHVVLKSLYLISELLFIEFDYTPPSKNIILQLKSLADETFGVLLPVLVDLLFQKNFELVHR